MIRKRPITAPWRQPLRGRSAKPRNVMGNTADYIKRQKYGTL